MTKKKTKKISIIASAVLVAAAATGAIYYFTHRNANELKKVPLAEIISGSEIPDKEYSNLDLSNAVLHVPSVDKLYSYYWTYMPQLYSDGECIDIAPKLFFKAFDYFDENDIAWVDINGDELPNNKPVYLPDEFAADGYVWDKNDKYTDYSSQGFNIDKSIIGSANYSYTGAFIITAYQPFDILFGMPSIDTRLVKRVRIDIGEQIPDETYLVYGKEYSPKQAVDFVDSFLAEISEYVGDYDLTLSDIEIIKNGADDYYSYRLFYEANFKGVPVSDSDIRMTGSYTAIQSPKFSIIITEPDRIGNIDSFTPLYCAGVDGELEDKFIPLEQAADIVSEFFAPNYIHKIDEITIKYVQPFEADKKYSSDEKIYAKPYWCFITYNDPTVPDAPDDELQREQIEDTIFVDMQTGEIIYYESSMYAYIRSTDDIQDLDNLR